MPRAMAYAICGFLVSVGCAQDASARQITFDIPEGRLADVLAAYSRLTSVQLIYRTEDVASVRSRGVRGTMSPERALSVILRGSNLSVRRFGSTTIALVKATQRPAKRDPSKRRSLDLEDRSEQARAALPEIIVTGEKLEGSLQHTSASIAVLRNEELEDYRIRSIKDLGAGMMPALRSVPYLGRSSALTLGMRGLVPTDATQITRDPTVGVYLNGVYLGRVQGLGAHSLDVERVEVLRGPQGTMFGRNSIGGAINIITKKPTGDYSAEARIGASSFQGREASIRFNLPIAKDVKASFAGSFDTDDGWVDNPLEDQSNWHQTRRKALMTSVLWTPSDSAELQYDWDRSVDESTSGYSVLMSLDENDLPVAPMFDVEGKRVRRARGGFLLAPNEGVVSGHTLRGSLKASADLTINTLLSWRRLRQDQWDQSAGIFDAYVPGGEAGRLSFASVMQQQFNGEISANGTIGSVCYQVGLFDFRERGQDRASVANTIVFAQDGRSYRQIFDIDLKAADPNRASEVQTKSQAVFGKLAWTPPVADRRFTLDAGIRFTDEIKRGRPLFRNGVPVEDGSARLPVIFKAQRLDPAASLSYDINERNRIYLRWSRAFRAGGANTRSPTFRSYGAEQISSWELGYKARLLNGALNFNFAAYASSLENPQIDVANFDNISRSETVNGVRPLRIHGFEADAKLLAAHGLMIDANVVHTKVAGGLREVTVDGTRSHVPTAVSFSPEYAASLSVTREFDLDGDLVAEAQIYGSLRGREFTGFSGEKTSGQTDLGANLDLRGVTIGRANWKIGVWAKNILNDRSEVWTYHNQWPTAFDLRIFNEPRSYGVAVTARM